MFETLTGLQYLQAEIACKHDKAFEKETWVDRLLHFETLDLTDPKTYAKASNPIGLRAAAKALEDTKNNNPTGYMVSLDACSSGLQILSMLVSCPKSFNLCGGVSDQCVDSYTTIYDSMNLHGALTRKQVKAAIMTSLYGSTAMPELTFGENVDIFYETMETMAPGAWDLNLGLQQLWDEVKGNTYTWVMPDNFHACIETQDKDLVSFKFDGVDFALPVKNNNRPEFHKGLGPNLIHSIDGMVVREMFRRCMFDPRVITQVIESIQSPTEYNKEAHNSQMVRDLWEHFKITGFLSVRILDFIRPDNISIIDDVLEIGKLIQSLPEQPFNVVSVHDCFRAHPNYGNDLRRQYNYIMADINDSSLLQDLCQQVSQSKMKINKLGKIPREDIIEGNYLLA